MLRGCSQLCLQTNELTGLFFIAAIFAASPIAAAYLLVAAAIAPVGRKLLGAPARVLATGLPGLNPSLIAVSLPSFYETGWTNAGMWGVLFVCIAAAVVLVHFLIAILSFPILIAPFLAIFWTLAVLEPHLGVLQALPPPATGDLVQFNPLSAVLMSLGQAAFSPTLASGLLFAAGLLANGWRYAVIAVLSAGIGTGVSYFYSGVDVAGADSGLYGFNAVLAGVAAYVFVGGGLRLALFAALVATILIPALSHFGVPALSAPFAATVWLLLALGWVDARWFPDRAAPAEAGSGSSAASK
ncbi:MAG: urea transporter [Pseudomonadota bacterium]